MKNLQPNQLSFRRILLFMLLVIAAIVGLITWKIVKSRQAFLVDITEVGFSGGGQICPEPLYDAHGNSYSSMIWGNIDSITYAGPAPLYSVDSSNYPNEPNGDPCWYPEKISPDVAVNGVKMYPLLLTVNTINNINSIRKGESTKLSAEAQLLERYPGGNSDDSVLFAVVVEPTSKLNVYFSLDSTNFEFTPPNEPTNISSLSFSQPTHQDWIISPDEDALGEQLFTVRLDDNDANDSLAGANITINVRDISGLNPTFIALLGASGTFLLGLFGILKIIPETWSLYKAKPNKKSKSKK